MPSLSYRCRGLVFYSLNTKYSNYSMLLPRNYAMNYKMITIGKEDHPIKFGFNALRKYSKMTNTSLADLDKLGQEMTLDNALILMYCGIEDGYRASKQEMKLSVDDLADSIDGDFNAIARCMEILGEMMGQVNEKKPNPKQKKN